MNNLRLALGCSETSSTRLPAYLRLALNKQAIASLPKIWHVPASITEAKELILLCRELPLETIETLICAADNDTDDVSINDIAMNDADHDSHLPKTKLSLIETQRNSEQYIESIDNDIVAIRDQLHAILTTTFSATTLPNDANINSLQTILQTALDYPCSQLTRILAYNNELIAQLLEDQLSLLIDTLLLTISDLKTVLSHRALLFQHFLLPKLCHTNTRPTRNLQYSLTRVAEQEPYACAHGILFLWPQTCTLETWHGDMIKKIAQAVPSIQLYIDAILGYWGSSMFSGHLHNQLNNHVIWNDTLYTLTTQLIGMPIAATSIRLETIRILIRVLTRQDATTANSIKFGLLAIALARQRPKAQQLPIDIVTALATIAEKMRPMQARQLRQCLQKIQNNH